MGALETLSANIAQLERRIRLLEGTQRSGLSSIAIDNGTEFEITSFGADNWQDDASGGTTPSVTVSTGRRAVMIATFRPILFGTAGSTVGINDFRSTQVVAGIQIDSTEPQDFYYPSMRAAADLVGTGIAGAFITIPVTFAPARPDLSPGDHEFKLRFYSPDVNPAGTVNPVITDMSLIVIPLGWG